MRVSPWQRALLAILVAVPMLCGPRSDAQAASPDKSDRNTANSAWAQSQHYVVLVSLGGLRWDDFQRNGAAHLLALGKQGASAPDGMVPSYPTLTSPNAYSLVSGLYPEHHGIVADSFLDPARGTRFDARNPLTANDASWYGGTPLWSLAESQGMRAACVAWPACEAKIAGYLATYSAPHSEKLDGEARVRQVLAWLRLPAAERPHFIAVYFSELDRQSRAFGPDAPQARAAVRQLDALVGKLKAGIDASGLPIDLVVVSDHGMAKTEGGWVTLGQFANLAGVDAVGPLLYGKTEADRQRIYNQLKKASSRFFVFRRSHVPSALGSGENARAGDPEVFATGPYAIRAHGPAAGQADAPPPMGLCGFDPRIVPGMKAVFFVAGPDILQGKTVAPFDNVNLYPWMAHMLGLKIARNDGSLNVLSGTLRDDGVGGEDK